ncbi:MAG: hypothetical protein Kow0037_07660 [Calditrichia bacterium]
MKIPAVLLVLFCGIISEVFAFELTWAGMFNGSVLSRQSTSAELQMRYFPKLSLVEKVNTNTTIDLYLEPQLKTRLFFNKQWLGVKENTILDEYRGWLRYSRPQWELRAGLQKINFGPARLLRSQQWFDQIDPRDPLSLSKGVYALLFRYYQLNNWNYWVWSVWQKDSGFYPLLKQQKNKMEWGGRVEGPWLHGMWGLTADSKPVVIEKIPVQLHRMALDAYYDWHLGYWVEVVAHQWDTGTNWYQSRWTLGMDYTLPFQNGIYLSLEMMGYSRAENSLNFKNENIYYALQANWPFNLFNSLSIMSFLDWKTGEAYYTITLTHRRQNVELHILGLYSSRKAQLPEFTSGEIGLGGKALMMLFVFYH